VRYILKKTAFGFFDHTRNTVAESMGIFMSWPIVTAPPSLAHYATTPAKLIKPL